MNAMKMPELCLFVSRVGYIERVDVLLDLVSEKDIAAASNDIGRENVANQSSLRRLAELYGTINRKSFKRVYFGQETCERLIPSSSDISLAVQSSMANGWDLTIVLPYVAPFGAEKIKALCPAIIEAGEKMGSVEVAVQDVAGLSIISGMRNGKVIPVLGRLFSRMKRDPRFPVDSMPHGPEFVPQDSVLSTIRRTSFENYTYVKKLFSLGVHRFGMDALPQGVDTRKVAGGMFSDIYWPWIYVTSGRACHVAGITSPESARHPVDEFCQMECRRMQIEVRKPQAFYSVAKGNAVWMECPGIGDISGNIDRLIYEPYIPV
jgi:hypothetical protein